MSHFGKIRYDMTKKFLTDRSAMVDGVRWYVVSVSPMVLEWIAAMPPGMFYMHVNSNVTTYVVDVHEQLYNMMVLKWT
jgi:hypothetical protein